ncbi:hypothetical protein GOBAR_DD03506 [Gossypium barbadense]|nr:hypothetical protein GOBAR_DD03506 [Gossypium barbadense]
MEARNHVEFYVEYLTCFGPYPGSYWVVFDCWSKLVSAACFLVSCNTDRAFFEDRPATGCSAFVRDDTGGFVSCRVGFTDGVLSPEAAELIQYVKRLDGLVPCKSAMWS